MPYEGKHVFARTTMKVLISGAGGFCGKHLTAYLEDQGVEVHRLTRSKDGAAQGHKVGDITSIPELTAVLASVRPDYVFHLAGILHGGSPVLFYRVNTQFAVALLEAIREADLTACPVLLAGTSAEYGMVSPQDLPVREDLSPHPYNHYGISKLAQSLAGLAAGQKGHPVVIARPFNIIGPGMPEHISIASFARQVADILEAKLPPVLEVGNMTTVRDFVDVRDLAGIYWDLIRTPSAYGQIVNICSGRGTLIGDMVSRLIELSGKRVEVKVDEGRLKPIDVPVHYGSNEKLKKILGRIPETDLETTLRGIFEDLRNR